jgi:hypothetical protein
MIGRAVVLGDQVDSLSGSTRVWVTHIITLEVSPDRILWRREDASYGRDTRCITQRI